MAADETRLLVLGAVILFEPLNGYQLRRELLSWNVDEWAHIKPGSIYSMLTTLARDGLLERFEVPDDGAGERTVSVYASTSQGRNRFHQMVSDELSTPRVMQPVSFHLALNFSVTLTREEVLDCLRMRLRTLSRVVTEFDGRVGHGSVEVAVPPHVVPTLQLDHQVNMVQVTWLREHIARLEGGAFAFDGEPASTWRPPPDDSGWEMVADRARYSAHIDQVRRARSGVADD